MRPVKTESAVLSSDYEYYDGVLYEPVQPKCEVELETEQRTTVTTSEFITADNDYAYEEPKPESSPNQQELEMGVFKLADEAQMGSLNSLMTDSYDGKTNQNGK